MSLLTMFNLHHVLVLISILLLSCTMVSGIERSFKNNLTGIHLRVAVPNDPPFTEIGADGQFEGVAVDAFKGLKEKLNFTYTMEEFPGGTRKFIEEMHSCSRNGSTEKYCRFDIGVGAFTVTHDKLLKQVSFVESFIESQTFRVVTKAKKTRTKKDYLLLFKPFSLELWFMLVGLWLMAILTVYLVYLWLGDTSRDTTPKNSVEALGSSIFAAFGWSPHAAKGRFLYAARAIILVMALIMCFVFISYESSVTSMKSLGLARSSRFRTVKDFANCRIMVSDIAVEKGSPAMNFLDRNIVTRPCNNKKKYQICDTFEKCLEKVLNGKADFAFTTSGVVDFFEHGRYCGDIVSVGESFMPQRVGYVVAKNSRFLEPLNLAMLRLGEEGRLPTLESKLQHCKALNEEETVLESELLLPFLVAGIIYLILIIVAVFSLLRRFRKRRKEQPSPDSMDPNNSWIAAELELTQDPEASLAYYRTQNQTVVD